MKVFIILIVFFSAGVSATSLFRVADFLEPIHALSPRNPNWPASITIDDLPTATIEQFMQLRTGYWREVYECNGKPVPDAVLVKDGLADGWVHARRELEYTRFHWQSTEVVRAPGGVPGDSHVTRLLDYAHTDSVQQIGTSSIFRIVPEKPDPEYKLRLGQVRETGEFVFSGNLLRDKMPCPDGSYIRVLRVPIVPPAS